MRNWGRALMVCLLLLASVSAAWPNGDFGREQAVMDSLRTVPPRQREFWLRQRGSELPGYTASQMTDSGLTLVGKWGRGPSVDVTVQDTLVALSLGSEVALLSFAQPDSPRVLSEIQLSYMAGQAQLAGNRLYINSGGSFEVWDIINPTQPVQRGRLGYGIGDFWVNDTFLYFIRADTFKAFSVGNPAAMYQLGACRDSGYFLTATANTAVLGHPNHGLYFIDITDPRSPHRAGSYSTDLPRSAAARGSLCCATVESRAEPYPIRLLTLNISNPASPGLLGSLNNAGGYDIYLDSSLAFASGRSWPDEPFQIISISDSAHPVLLDSCTTTDRYNWGVWASLRLHRALVADECAGLALVDISSLNNAVLDTWVLATGPSVDVRIDGQRCYVANNYAGMRILDITDPTRPACLGEFDSLFSGDESYCVEARDSFAFVGRWPQPVLRSVLVADPAHPLQVGACPTVNFPKDMVLRDTFLYIAEDNRLQIVNVARPRSPTVVGTCNLPGDAVCLFVKDSFAYVGSWPSQIISVRQPTQPTVIGSFDMPLGGIVVEDTFAYVARTYDSMYVYSVARPTQPLRLGSLCMSGGIPYGQWNRGLAKVDTIVYIGGWQMKVVSVADPARPFEVDARWAPPSLAVQRIEYVPPFLYVACGDGGVSVLETLQTGIVEQPSERGAASVVVEPTVTSGCVRVTSRGLVGVLRIGVYNVAGELVELATCYGGMGSMDLSFAPAGAYVVRAETRTGCYTARVVKVRRR